ncbi:DNA topoisomerase I [Candidatus Peregrinibacteria bacterium CG11_big_fil_rev_8_21_14_0_20_46_8]|nr:MAG: DNA topoisomerase I [Candidatus Peregrinibacteria bacterium CG11_big_fil_rev_8_21_14_0_20_46_8]
MPTKNLIIVESPAKAKTISRFVGKEYVVKASMGHVRDLPKSKIGVEIEKDFEPTYKVMTDKKKVITELKSKIGDNTTIWIATDEDREGEAIGWHLLKALKVDDGDARVKRIVFHEITKGAILNALEHPRELDARLIDAQQARRVLDRLVGYELSPLLWKKIRYGLSAGRVQSVAVRLIVEREREIRAFKPEEYWSITAHYIKDGNEFAAELNKIDGEKAKIDNESASQEIMSAIEGKPHLVGELSKKEVKRNPSPPFITSTLQQEASRKLGFSVKKTMMLAQKMYEGVEIGGQTTGLITYMRTDSVNLSKVALDQARQVIEQEFGKEYVLDEPRMYKSKKGAQEAHEAIRPTDLALSPTDAKAYLDKDSHRLYDLIWKRTLACQMQQAILEQVGADIIVENTKYQFRATGQTIKFAGFMKAYTEGRDHPEEELQDKEKILPELSQGEKLDVQQVVPEQHFTKPPARYTEASLVKKLESEGIGRPSTYAPTISTVITRGYVEKEQKQLKPTDVGEVVNDVLVEHFPDIVDIHFTAKMEESLDAIAEGKVEWRPLMKDFYGPFHKNIEVKDAELQKHDLITEKTDEVCEKCGKPMEIKLGRFGKFLSCTGYPECKNAKPFGKDPEKQKEEDEKLKELQEKHKNEVCEKCGSAMEVKRGRFGPFLGCSKYPECKNIRAIVNDTGIKCWGCGEGHLVERRTRKGGRVFWGCNRFPKCKTATWDKPLRQCDKCEQGVIVDSKKEEREKCTVCG